MADDRKAKLAVVFILFLLLLNFPILHIFDRQSIWMGMPVLYFYLFFVWLILIVVVGLIVRKKQ
jgi:hypothetical protein